MWAILYIQPLNQHCIDAMKLTSMDPNSIHVVDINSLQNKPSWLVGVPTLLIIDTKKLYLGTECLIYLKNKTSHLK